MPTSNQTAIVKHGFEYGVIMAMICSFSANQSIIWALVHGWLSWFYVIYFACAY